MKNKLENNTGSNPPACSAARGHETFIKGAELTMRFDTNEDAVAFFDWVVANTHHKKQNVKAHAPLSA